MKKTVGMTLFAVTFFLGIMVGNVAAKKAGVSAAAWMGASSEEAAARILAISEDLAEGGSWQNIHVGRVYYLSGEKAKAEAIFERYAGGKEAGDQIRIGRVYAHAGEWAKAKPYFDRVLELQPKDEDWLVEIGAFYNLNGDREHAEELFARSFRSAPKSLANALNAAGSYVGVTPRKR